jgi:hypothetical protein
MRQDVVSSAIMSIRSEAPPLITAQRARRDEMLRKLPKLKHIQDTHVVEDAGICLELGNFDQAYLELVSRLEAIEKFVRESRKRVQKLNKQLRAQFFEEV